ncbi:MAG: glycine--tRNA ligase subunit beta [Hasllibacter sp.]
MDLLIELFSEEIPARMQARARADLKRLMTDGLVEAGLTYAAAEAMGTPRRLTLAIEGLTERTNPVAHVRSGPAFAAPEAAKRGFLRAFDLQDAWERIFDTTEGLGEDQHIEENGVVFMRGEARNKSYIIASYTPANRDAAAIVAEVLERTVRDFPWPKSMRWGTGTLRWVRPLRRILCILTREDGHEVVPLTVDGIDAGDVTEGHRFMAPAPFAVTGFEDYAAKLKRARVLLSPDERAEAIASQIDQMAFASGLEPVEDRGLLAEVAGLVEWPVPLMGEIGEDFLDLPPEVLVTSMKEHQKFFSLKDRSGQVTRFVTVANIEAPDGGDAILAGNRRVLAARLSDAKFFWENDLATARAGMGDWLGKLGSVTFHARLGTQAERIERVEALAREIATSVGADPDAAALAARLAKADLASEMVYEFPELQGTMGRYYVAEALKADPSLAPEGHFDAIAAAAEAHYRPLGPTGDVPTDPVAVTVALADKIDTLTGFWAIDEKPTGSKDPYALRRAALGVIRLVLENDLRLPLAERLGGAWGPDLLSFLHDRLKVFLRDRGVRHDVIDASLAMPNADDLALLSKRAAALQALLDTEDGTNLIQGFRRADNILRQAEAADGVEYSFGPDPKFADADEERALFAALDAAEPRIDEAMDTEDFEAAMRGMAALRAPIDAFFEAVQVNDERGAIRRNRLNLLHRVRATLSKVADLRRIEG